MQLTAVLRNLLASTRRQSRPRYNLCGGGRGSRAAGVRFDPGDRTAFFEDRYLS